MLDFDPWEERLRVSSDGRRVKAAGEGGGRVFGVGGSGGEPSD